MSTVVLITGAGSGFGLMGANTLAKGGHTVYGWLHSLHGSKDDNKDARVKDVVLDITSKESIDATVQKILSEAGRLDSVIHNAGHMGMGPAESFSAEQYHQYYEINAVRAHRLNQAVVPHMRKAGRGHLVWISSSSCREIACWGIETTMIVPGIFTSGTNHFVDAGKPTFPDVASEYMNGPLKGADTIILENVSEKFPKDASPQLVGDAILKAVDAPVGHKPFRLALDPFQDGSDEIMALADEMHLEYLERCEIREICSLAQKQ